MQKYNSRKDVPDKYKWDLKDFYKDEKDFNEELTSVKNDLKKVSKYVGCTKKDTDLLAFLEFNLELERRLENLYVYSYLINDQELGKKESIERKSNIEKLVGEYNALTSFFNPELLKLSKEEYNALFNNKDLLKYKNYLDLVYRDKDHILSESEEQIVSKLVTAMDHFDDISSTMLNSEHNYGKVKVDNETITIATNNCRSLMRNKNREVRKTVYNKFNKKIDEYSTTSASLLNSYVSMNNELASIRKYKSSWDEHLFGLNMDDKVFRALVNTVEENLPSLHKYYELRREILGLDKLTCYDLVVPLNEIKKEYTIEDAQELILNALKPLGEEYLSHYKKVFDNHYIDYCQYKGKCSGGYSFATLDKDSRILMSYNYDLDSVSTIAHEGGHNVHHQFLKENNPIMYRNPESIVCEVASLTNECLLSNYLVNNGTKEEQLAGLANIINVIVSNLFGAVREGYIEEKFNNLVHKGGTITKEFMDKEVLKSLKKYYGPAVKVDKKAKNSWVNRSHYYMSYYLYSYAICISVASYVATNILNGNKDMLTKYIAFLKTGSDKWPMEAFEVLGINLESKEVYENAIKYFDSLVTKYKEIKDE